MGELAGKCNKTAPREPALSSSCQRYLPGPLERRSYPADVHKHDSLSNFHQSLFLAAFILWAAFGFWFFAFCLCYCYARRDIVTFGGTKEKQPIPTDGDGWIAACKIANLNIFTLPRYFLRYAVGHLCGRQGVEGAVPNGSRSAGDQTTKRFRMLMNAQIQQTNLNDSRSQSRRCRSPKLRLKAEAELSSLFQFLYDFNTNQLALRWAGGRGGVKRRL